MHQLKQIREPQIMGILNVTEDSFSDGGSYLSLELAMNRARQMIEEGAAIIDVGAESTRPGSLPVDLDTELERVVPTVEAIKKEFPAITVSVDTRKSEVAKASLQAGATIINDISALRDDEQMAETVASHPGAQIVLMHMQGDPRTMQIAPRYENILKEVDEFFEERISFAVERGIDREMIILDPGIGFGKDLDHNLTLLANLEHYKHFGLPLLLATSRKSFINAICPTKPKDRVAGTIASSLIGALQGVDMIRVHDVMEHKQFFAVLRETALRWSAWNS